MAACLPYLEEQIELIDPKIIVLLGSTALKGLFGNTMKITHTRGNWLIWNNRLVMPTYHPSALLRNPNLKKDAWEDFKKVILKYRELVDTGHQCEYI
jgi:DNA polymerase